MHRNRLFVASALVALTSPALVSPAQAAQTHGGDSGGDPPWRTVATGLDNPRQLSFSGGSLYVAEAGVGGSGPCVTGPEGESCFGLSGAITRITSYGSKRVVTGLPSLASPEGGGAIGPHDVVVPAFRRGSDHTFAVTIGLGAPPEVRKTFGAAGRALGTVVTGSFHDGKAHILGDLAAYEERHNPDGNPPDSNPADSNPTGMMRDGGSVVVTDSGANDLQRVRRDGRIKTLAVFPNRMVPSPDDPATLMPMQAVPTSVVRGPDDAYYVSQLTGYPFPAGGSNIWRVVPGQAPTVYATGLTNVTDLAWHDGSLYAVQLSTTGLLTVPPGTPPTGSLVKVASGAAPTPVAEGLPAPYGVALRGGKAFVTTCAVCPDGGSVVAIDLD
ncbi:ScyD/ScyE family protein [Nocardioides sp. P5_C9_2]